MNLNLDSLKEDVTRYLEENDFVVFHGEYVDLDSYPVRWNAKANPDYQAFLHVARRSGANLIVVQSREFDRTDMEVAYELLDEADLAYDEEEAYRKRLLEYEGFYGFTSRLRLGFQVGFRAYTYDVEASWYEEFEEICDELEDATYYLDEEEDEEDPGDMGFFSKN